MIHRVERLRRAMIDIDVDAFLITSATNRMYLSGFSGSNGWLLITPDEQYIVTDFRYVVQVQQESPDFTLAEGDDLFHSLGGLLGNANGVRVAFEAAHTTVNDQKKHCELLPAVT